MGIGTVEQGCDGTEAERHGTVSSVIPRCRRPRAMSMAISIIAATVALAGCGDDGPTPDANAFCDLIATRRSDIVTPSIATEVDIDTTLALYRELGGLAPLAISTEWEQLTRAVDTAATVVAGDNASLQRAAQQAYASERAAVAVAEWVQISCGVDLGPVTTIAPQDQATPANPPGYDDSSG